MNLSGVGEIYQDVWSRGKVIRKGVRECETRYVAVRKILKRYSRPFTVLDVGCALGYFLNRIKHDFSEACVVGLETHAPYYRVCRDLVQEKGHFVLQRRTSPKEILNWSRSECFDVILAMSVIHHMPGSLVENIKLLRKACRHLIIEIPVVGEKACSQQRIEKEYHQMKAFLDQEGTLLAETPTHTLAKRGIHRTLKRPTYLVQGTWTGFTRTYVAHPRDRPIEIAVTCEYDRARLVHKAQREERDLIPGFNLHNLMVMGAKSLPLSELAEAVPSMSVIGERNRRDVRPWNLIVNGQGQLTLIDPRDNQLKEDWDKVVKKMQEGIRKGVTEVRWYPL